MLIINRDYATYLNMQENKTSTAPNYNYIMVGYEWHPKMYWRLMNI